MVQSCRRVVINLSSYTGNVSKLVAVLLLLAVFGASMQCVADCLPQPNTPPCHQHSQKHSPKHSPENAPCKHGQLVAVTHSAGDQPVAPVAYLTLAAEPSETSENPPLRLLTILRI